ncbi:hypothetical protein A2714_03250 [Candidatus Woesebacteria bacterium RIFCSPHIGHO2_01_FULL_38_9]|uniref:Uncharacterized protein n=2 Tax=Candidatus Woeseibacteriota TaxID=1752722 RepID=A0A1F7Y3D8_9BACT|nr:MAG: hypothetical protein A2714_03250 [Candidatus Woesebacteria bacterium RIFCSPHIGHO2_01_FULL_38_9]OGM61058.1 MAG: hypothetical protein A3A75_02760 [Candidatus Woesebacteria bacterium RIFCSPLOWO2_01_FULL_39_10]
MNPIALRIKSALRKWKIKAEVDLLEAKDIAIPRVYISGKKNSKKTVIISSGLHLDETSGPLLLLDSEILLAILAPYLERGVSFYPPSQKTESVSSRMNAKNFLLRRGFAPDEAVGRRYHLR